MPSWPIAIPSQTPITPNSKGTPPPAAIPSRTRSASWRRWTWPGTAVDQAFAIPMNGRSISRSVTPSDRRSDRFGARWYPTFVSSLRMVHWMRSGPAKAYGSPIRISPASASTVASTPSGRSAIGRSGRSTRGMPAIRAPAAMIVSASALMIAAGATPFRASP